jgi:hypothetical protein
MRDAKQQDKNVSMHFYPAVFYLEYKSLPYLK